MGAAVVQGVPASTLDLDIVHHRTSDNVRRLLVCVAEWDARFRGDPRPLVPNESHLIGPRQILLTTIHGDIDLLGTVDPAEHPLDYEALLPRSRVIDFGSFSARVLELSALIELKKQAGRPKGPRHAPDSGINPEAVALTLIAADPGIHRVNRR
jgi:hypothetical protein